MPCFYLIPKQDDFNKIPEIQVCIAKPYSKDVPAWPARFFSAPGAGQE